MSFLIDVIEATPIDMFHAKLQGFSVCFGETSKIGLPFAINSVRIVDHQRKIAVAIQSNHLNRIAFQKVINDLRKGPEWGGTIKVSANRATIVLQVILIGKKCSLNDVIHVESRPCRHNPKDCFECFLRVRYISRNVGHMSNLSRKMINFKYLVNSLNWFCFALGFPGFAIIPASLDFAGKFLFKPRIC